MHFTMFALHLKGFSGGDVPAATVDLPGHTTNDDAVENASDGGSISLLATVDHRRTSAEKIVGFDSGKLTSGFHSDIKVI